MSEACPLREATCPFLEVGCMKVVHQKDIADHLIDMSNSHLMLAMNRYLFVSSLRI